MTILTARDDIRIRRQGYMIHARPKDGEPQWKTPGGEVWPQWMVWESVLQTEAEANLKPKKKGPQL